MEDEGDSQRLRLLIAVRDESGHQMQMREYPSFDLLYQLEVSSFLRLLDCSPNQEIPLMLEGSASAENENRPGRDVVQFLRVRGICESVLEARLDRLVHRQRFDEAEKFARDFKLPVEQVHRGRTAWLLERLSPWRKKEMSAEEEEELMQKLKETLKKIRYKNSLWFNFLICCDWVILFSVTFPILFSVVLAPPYPSSPNFALCCTSPGTRSETTAFPTTPATWSALTSWLRSAGLSSGW